MAVSKFSQIAAAGSPPALTDTLVGVQQSGPNDLRYTLSQIISTILPSAIDGQALVFNGGTGTWQADERIVGPNATVSGNAGSTVLIAAGTGLGAGAGGNVGIYAGTAGASGTQGEVLIAGGGGTRPPNASTTAGYMIFQGPRSGYGGSVTGRGGYSTGMGGVFTFIGGNGATNGGGALYLRGGQAIGVNSIYGGNCGLYGGTGHGTKTTPQHSRGGNLRMIAGYGSSTNANGGVATFIGGGTSGSGTGGIMNLYGGPTYGSGTGGAAYISGGNAYNTGTGGKLFFQSGKTNGGGKQIYFRMYAASSGGGGAGGNGLWQAGQGGATGNGGSLKIYAGLGGATSGNGGDVIIKPGTVTSGTIGHFILKNLPTSNAGLTSGMVWNNAGVLNIV